MAAKMITPAELEHPTGDFVEGVLLTYALNLPNGIDDLLDFIFSFLSRNTNIYTELSRADAEKLIQASFRRQYVGFAKKPRGRTSLPRQSDLKTDEANSGIFERPSPTSSSRRSGDDSSKRGYPSTLRDIHGDQDNDDIEETLSGEAINPKHGIISRSLSSAGDAKGKDNTSTMDDEVDVEGTATSYFVGSQEDEEAYGDGFLPADDGCSAPVCADVIVEDYSNNGLELVIDESNFREFTELESVIGTKLLYLDGYEYRLIKGKIRDGMETWRCNSPGANTRNGCNARAYIREGTHFGILVQGYFHICRPRGSQMLKRREARKMLRHMVLEQGVTVDQAEAHVLSTFGDLGIQRSSIRRYLNRSIQKSQLDDVISQTAAMKRRDWNGTHSRRQQSQQHQQMTGNDDDGNITVSEQQISDR